MDSSQTTTEQKCRDYIRALEEERKKIQVFQRELPLCLQLVTSAIESVRQQVSAGQEAVSVDRPVLEEFIPLKPRSSLEEEDDGSRRHRKSSPAVAASVVKKPDWLKSVQLWNQYPEAAADVEPPKKPVAVNVKNTGGAFQPFKRLKCVAAPVASTAAATSSTTSGSGGVGSGSSGCVGSDDKKEKVKADKEKDKDYKDKEGHSQANRKTRRCWSPELHRRFLNALQQLGGSHAATPKQIRERMKVDGLTNDEVKSHLQKYRLHTRKPSPAIQSNSTGNPPAPQFVVVGGIWMPPPPADYAAAVTVSAQTGGMSSGPPSEIYAPVASHPSEKTTRLLLKNKKQSHRSPTGPLESEGRCSAGDDDDVTHSASHSTSSSSQTTTASPPVHL